MREMQMGEGGYCSSLDADSEGEEGRFYVWQRDEVAQHLGADEFAAFAAHYGLDAASNFEGHAWHLHAKVPLADVASRLGRPPVECEALIASARARLFAVREARVRPGRDDKVLTAWNALAIDGMAFAARVFGEPRWADSARRAIDFIRAAMWRDGRLLATDSRAQLNGYLDDHAFLLAALLELMQGDMLRAADLHFACELAELMLGQFEDARDGGFFFTRHDHEALVLRPKSGHDGSVASGNGVAALQLQRLGHLGLILRVPRRIVLAVAGDVVLHDLDEHQPWLRPQLERPENQRRQIAHRRALRPEVERVTANTRLHGEKPRVDAAHGRVRAGRP